MDLQFSEEHNILRETVRNLCDRYASTESVRELEDDAIGYSPELWGQLGELGLIGLLLPEEFGGADQGFIEGVILYEELGRALAPVPHFVSSVLGGRALAAAGSAAQKERWLGKIASGEAIFSPAWLEPSGGFDAAGVQLEAKAADGGFELSGRKHSVSMAGAADRLVVLARTGPGPEEVDLFLIDPSAPGVERIQHKTMASDAQFEVRFDRVAVGEEDRIGGAGTGWSTWMELMREGIILLAGQAIGGAGRALEITVEYAKQRQQFGKPLGAFQSLAHYMADAATSIDGGRTLVYEAAWAHDRGRAIQRLAPMAKAFACETFTETTKTAQQIHGGMGFSVEYDIQLYFRRAKQLQASWWDNYFLEELIAADVLDGEGPPDLNSAPA